MADLDAQVREAAQTRILAILKELGEPGISGLKRSTLLAELASLNRTVEASAYGAAYPSFSPSSIGGRHAFDGMAEAQADSAPN